MESSNLLFSALWRSALLLSSTLQRYWAKRARSQRRCSTTTTGGGGGATLGASSSACQPWPVLGSTPHPALGMMVDGGFTISQGHGSRGLLEEEK
ncbi:hypothetical protein LIER_11458 [Lithospermum erythrorhizon]|uniref:Secreted protein n=1 Tax=Lithospermum erythrorhizon TaxID=34254 RepID=A0AAV3PN50_LITER